MAPLDMTLALVPKLTCALISRANPREVAQYGRNWAEVTFLSHLYKERAKLRKDALPSKETDVSLFGHYL